MAKRSRGNTVSWKQAVIALVLTISVAYGVAITDVLSRTVRSRGRVEALESQVQGLEEQIAQLEEQIESAGSRAFIEEVARSELKQHGEDDVPLVPVVRTPGSEMTLETPTPTPRPTPRPTISGSLPGRWEELLRLILRGFGR